jgi:crotonobetaine/carnitine-CoA ligase
MKMRILGLADDRGPGEHRLVRGTQFRGAKLPPAPVNVGYAIAVRDGGSFDHVNVSAAETMMLMFTSGTTSNPKAAVISHGACMSCARSMHGSELAADDVPYTELSLTHINAQGTLRIGLTAGLPVVISRKFSKRHLWPICRRFGCNSSTFSAA